MDCAASTARRGGLDAVLSQCQLRWCHEPGLLSVTLPPHKCRHDMRVPPAAVKESCPNQGVEPELSS